MVNINSREEWLTYSDYILQPMPYSQLAMVPWALFVKGGGKALI